VTAAHGAPPSPGAAARLAGQGGELVKRVASALVLAPLAIACVWFGGAALATLLGCAAAAGAWEFYRIAAASGARPFARTGVALAGATPILVHGQLLGVLRVPATAVALVPVALLGLAVWRRGVEGRPLAAVGSTVLGVLYVAVPLSYGYALRAFEYAVGRGRRDRGRSAPRVRHVGERRGRVLRRPGHRRPKLIPSVSPGKTVSGALGGLALAAAVAVAYEGLALKPYAQLAFAPWRGLLFGLLVSAAAQLGDTVESLLKRDAASRTRPA
jgi:phosphatidate cytidylyltransferase